MKLFPKTFRAPENHVAILQAILAGYDYRVPPEQIAATLTNSSEVVQEQVAIIAKAAETLGCTVGPTAVSAEYILAAQTPTIAPVRFLPQDPPYFIVIWNKIGPLYQILDPTVGRRWLSRTALLEELYQEPIVWDKEACWEILQHSTQIDLFQQRLTKLRITAGIVSSLLVDASQSTESWSQLAAALRLVEEMRPKPGTEAEQLLHYFLNSDNEDTSQLRTIPAAYHTVLSTENVEQVLFQGVLAMPILTCDGIPTPISEASEPPEQEPAEPQQTKEPANKSQKGVFSLILQFMREEGMLHPVVIVTAILFAAAGVFLEAILLRGLMEIGLQLDEAAQRGTVMVLVLAFIFGLFLLQWALSDQTKRIGRRIDLRLRQLVFAAVPHLSDQYFQKLAPGNIVDRVYNAQNISGIATNFASFMTTVARVLMITIGLAWIDWPLAPISWLLIYLGVAIYRNFSTSLYQDSYRSHTINSWLSVLYVDGLRGRSAIWSHGAERAVRYEYEQGLTTLGGSILQLGRRGLLLNATLFLATISSPIIQLIVYTGRGGTAGNLLLLFYWQLELNSLITTAVTDATGLIGIISHANRFGEVLQTPPEESLVNASAHSEDLIATTTENAPYIDIENITVRVEEQTVLNGISLTIEKGEHVAIIGRSGAGKSTLVGLLLGRHYATTGDIRINGEPFDYALLQQLRRETAWVDPHMHLWDDSLLYNLQYGSEQDRSGDLLYTAIKQADLLGVLERLPNGLTSRLGESGRRISGGEGQRVRFGRGLHRYNAPLVILDESFRGLDREKRFSLLQEARLFWKESTMLCVTHDVSQTLPFSRVLVLENGRVVEDGVPEELLSQPDSHYRALLEEEEMVRTKLLENETWRHLRIAAGTVTEQTTST